MKYSLASLLALASILLCACPATGRNAAKSIKAKYIAVAPSTPERIPSLFASYGVRYNSVESVNWAEKFPYCPKTEFAVACTDSSLLLHFRVDEDCVMANCDRDQQWVFQDACVEFFCSPCADSIYYNMEFNCIGTLLMAGGSGRYGRTPADSLTLGSIRRWASLGREPFPLKMEPTHWELAVIVPAKAFFLNDVKSFRGRTIRANVNKCGQKMPLKAYVTWSPILLEKTEFHSPQFFGEIKFK